MDLLQLIASYDLTKLVDLGTAPKQSNVVVGEMSDTLKRILGLMNDAHEKCVSLGATKKGKVKVSAATHARNNKALDYYGDLHNLFFTAARLEFEVLHNKDEVLILQGFKLAYNKPGILNTETEVVDWLKKIRDDAIETDRLREKARLN